jgi:hypothetical protein
MFTASVYLLCLLSHLICLNVPGWPIAFANLPSVEATHARITERTPLFPIFSHNSTFLLIHPTTYQAPTNSSTLKLILFETLYIQLHCSNLHSTKPSHFSITTSSCVKSYVPHRLCFGDIFHASRYTPFCPTFHLFSTAANQVSYRFTGPSSNWSMRKFLDCNILTFILTNGR